MIQVSGIYSNGNIILDKIVSVDKPVKVLVTFEDQDLTPEKKVLSINYFSFFKSRELLKDVKGNLSDAVIEDRKSQL